MPVSLEEASRGAQTDLDTAVIDEFRKESAIMDALTFDDCVNPSGGGAVLTYGYRRQHTQAGAAFRTLNTEYTPGEVETRVYTVTLAPLGGSFQIDRVIATIGAPSETALQMTQKIKATNAKFTDAVINGDTAVEANGFDGLDKALAGSSTEIGVGSIVDWSDFDTAPRAEHKALDTIDSFLSVLDGSPTMLIGNAGIMARVRAAARRAGMYTRNPVEGLLGQNGRPIVREQYGDLLMINAGAKAGSNADIIPTISRDLDSSVHTLTFTGTISGGTFTLTATVLGDAQTAAGIPWNATNADIKAALEALSNIGAGDVTVTGTTTKTVTFAGSSRFDVVALAVNSAGITGGGSIAAATSGTATAITNLTDLYAVRLGLDGFHAVSTVGPLVQTWLPDFSTAGAVKTGEVEMGPVAVALKASKAAAVLRNIKLA